jgi:tRNA(Arg) A34 adenosine deaminase TadA
MAQHGNRDVAVAVRVQANIPNTTAYAFNTAVTRWDTRTSIVNLLQSCSGNGISVGNEVYTTEIPTSACIGIAKAQQVRFLYFVYNGQLCYVDTTPSPAPTIHQRQIVNLNVRPPGAERLQPALPDPAWLNTTKAAAGTAARTWYLGLNVAGYNAGTRTRTALNSVAAISAAAANGIAPLADFRMAGPTAAVAAPTAPFRDRLFMALVRVIAARAWQHAGGGPNLRTILPTAPLGAGKNIAAVLVNQSNQIIGWGVNTNDNSTTRHAETNAIQSYQNNQGTALPAGTRIYSTLDPCFMCAALYLRAGGQFCLYEQADPNMTNNTALGNASQQYHEPFTGTPGASTSIAQTLDTARATSGQVNVPLFLRTDDALHVYSYAHERLVTTGMRAATPADRQLFQNVLGFLRNTGFLAAVGQRPDLFLDDEVATRRL